MDLGASRIKAFFKVVFPDLLPGILSGFLAELLSAVISRIGAAIVLLASKKATRKDGLPFGPFFYLGYLATLLMGTF